MPDPQTLPALIRSKYPGQYDDINDQDLDAKVRAKFPGVYDDIPKPSTSQASVQPTQAATTGPEPNTLGTFASHVGAQVNPIAMIGALGHALLHPVDTAKQLGGAQMAVLQKAKDSYQKGNYIDAAVHTLNGLTPLIGPTVDTAAERVQRGEIAAGMGDAVGLGAMLATPEAIKGTARAVAGTGAAEKLAAGAEAGAKERVAQLITPSGSSREIRQLGKQAANVAPDVLRGTDALTPKGLSTQIGERYGEAADRLDAAYDAIPKTKGYSTRPLLNKLQEARAKLTVEGTGGNVTSETVSDRAATLDKAIKEVQALGPFTNTDNLVKLRNQWKEGAKLAFVPEINPNVATIRGTASGWADAWSGLQDTLVERHPELKPLNADYRIWKQANDIVTALADRERVRPTVGRSIMARAGGAAVGGATGGAAGMAIGEILGPVVERGLNNRIGPTTKLTIARVLQKTADAVRAGDVGKAKLLLSGIRPLLGVASQGQAGVLVPTMAIAQAPAEPVGTR